MCASSFGPRLWNLQKQGKINRGFAWIKTAGLSTHGLCQCSAWLACVCAQLKITISIYLYQRGRAKKNLACKRGWRSHRSCRSGDNWAALSQEVTALELITLWHGPFSWGARLAVPTAAAVHKAGAKVTQQACSEVMQHCSHPAPPREHSWVPLGLETQRLDS